MLIVYPLCGFGQRFADMGYDVPKPLIMIHGEPLIKHQIRSLRLKDDDKIVFIVPANFPTQELQRMCPECIIITLYNPTKGALDTVQKGLEKAVKWSILSPSFLERTPILSLDCDVVFKIDIVQHMRKHLLDGAIAVFEEANQRSCYSFIECDSSTGYVTRIKEKHRISNLAVCGAYGFKSAMYFMQYAETCLHNHETMVLGEFYMSVVIQNMIDCDQKISAVTVPFNDIIFLGTPEELVDNLPLLPVVESKRFCFDLDGTLVSFPKVKDDYHTVEPIMDRIYLVRRLYDAGHTIIVHTARRMRTHRGDVAEVIRDISQVTIETLQKFNIPYHELVFGKPWADVYVDDLAVNAKSNVWKKVGLVTEIPCESRPFNEVTLDRTNRTVTKRGMNDKSIAKIHGEIYWYENMPSAIADLFPLYQGTLTHREGYVMGLVDGPSLSTLYVHEFLTPNQLDMVLTQLQRIHDTFEASHGMDVAIKKVKVCHFYKIKLYERCDTNTSDLYKQLEHFLTEYEKNDEATIGNIHGDPVFTNIIWCKTSCKWIDMRGMIANEYALWGDVLYDYAKIYQSLVGYDEIFHNTYVNMAYKTKMIQVFWKHIDKVFGHRPNIRTLITWLTKYLLLTLLPCHEMSDKREQFELLITEL